MSESLVERLKAHLLSSGYGPSDQIETEHELARQLGVTRSRVREALLALCQQGLLERRARAGTRIRAFDAASTAEELAFRFSLAGFDTSEAAEARWVIETAVLQLAIRRMTPKHHDRLLAHIEAMEALRDKFELADSHDRDFHLTLLEACGNQTLQAFAGVIEALFRTTVRKSFMSRPLVERAIKEHRALMHAIEEGDEEAALGLMREHLNPKRYIREYQAGKDKR